MVFSNRMVKALCLLLLFFLSANAQACICPDIRSGKPSDNPDSIVRSAGVGYWFYYKDKKIFKFIKCYNRPDCTDLSVPNKESIPFSHFNFPEQIYTYFNSFEEANAFDEKMNNPKEKEKRIAKSNSRSCEGCSSYNSISNIPFNGTFKDNLIMETHPSLKSCQDCKDLKKLGDINYHLKDIKGKFSLKDQQIIFEPEGSINTKAINLSNSKCDHILKDLTDKSAKIYIKDESLIKNKTSQSNLNICNIKIKGF